MVARQTIYIIWLVDNENLLGYQAMLLRYILHHLGLPFVLPLVRGIVVYPALFVGGVWAFQYGLTSNVYYDEYDGEARETAKPKFGWSELKLR